MDCKRLQSGVSVYCKEIYALHQHCFEVLIVCFSFRLMIFGNHLRTKVMISYSYTPLPLATNLWLAK